MRVRAAPDNRRSVDACGSSKSPDLQVEDEMVAFRQVIFPGDVGVDVLVVKRALRRMGVKGSGAMNLSRRAGPAFVDAVRAVQRGHALTIDGKYGKNTH